MMKLKVGRPTLPKEQRTVRGSIRLIPARWIKLRKLGSAWLNEQLDKTEEPHK